MGLKCRSHEKGILWGRAGVERRWRGLCGQRHPVPTAGSGESEPWAAAEEASYLGSSQLAHADPPPPEPVVPASQSKGGSPQAYPVS